jgi:hypothetical protein
MPNMHTLFPSKYLRGTDLAQPVQVRVKHVSVEPVGPEREDKPVAHFVGGEVKPVILNKTNCTALITITGSEDSDDWGGARVELYRDTVLMHGEATPCIRIRAIRSAEEHEDNIPETWGDEPVRAAKKPKKA